MKRSKVFGVLSARVLLVGLVRGQTPPTAKPAPPSSARGNAAAGREVFRFETFGNEGFWTDAMRMPKGVLDAKLIPLQALDAGLLVDIEALDPAMRDALGRELGTDRSAANAPMLNDVKTTVRLIEANAVVGLVPKDSKRRRPHRSDVGRQGRRGVGDLSYRDGQVGVRHPQGRPCLGGSGLRTGVRLTEPDLAGVGRVGTRGAADLHS